MTPFSRRIAPLPGCLAATVAALAMGACAPAPSTPLAERTVRVVATTGMIGDAVTRIGGPRVEVETLMGPGVDPHLYKATEGDVRRLFRADLVLYNGLHLEAKLADIFEDLRTGAPAIAVGEAVPHDRLLRPAGYEGGFDPHVWHDVGLWLHAVRGVEEALAQLDPLHADGYRERGALYRSELESLDVHVRALAQTIPPARRVLVTAHDAFNYFGRAYGIEVRGLQGISTVAEPGAADVQALAAFMVGRRIPALFVESSVSPRAVEAVQAAVRARGGRVRIGGDLFSDALGDAGTPEGTYVGMIRHNVDVIARALGEP
jgi:manganese/zinc/iron transport system substrate-binding protein